MTAGKTLSQILRIASTIAMFAMVLISIFVYHTNALGLGMFFAYMLFFVEIPGLLILELFRVDCKHYSVRLLLGLFTGWAMVVGEYYTAMLTPAGKSIYAVGPVLSVIWAVKLLLSSRPQQPGKHYNPVDVRRQKFSFSRVPAAFFLFAALLMLYIMLYTQFRYMAPGYGNTLKVSMDKVFQMGIVSSLTHSYPALNPWVDGFEIHYHIFTQILLSVPVTLVGMRPDFMIMSCAPLLNTYVMSISVYAMFRYFCKRKERAGLYSLSFMLAHVFIAKTITESYVFRIILTNDNYGGTGIAASVACIIMLDIFLKSAGGVSRAKTPELITDRTASVPVVAVQSLLLIALFMLMTGIKAPVALVIIGAVIGTLLVGVILRRIKLIAVVPVALLTGGFLAVYKFLLTSGGSSGVGGDSIIGLAKITGLCFWKKPLIAMLKSMGLPVPVRLAIMLCVFLATYFTIYLLPFAVGYLRELVLVIRGKKPYDFARVTVYAAALVGFVLLMILRYKGHSQIYFGIVTTMYAPLIAMWFFEDVGKDSAKWMRWIANICKVVFFAVLIITTASLGNTYRSLVPTAVKYANPDAKFKKYTSISPGEQEALEWMRASTPEDSLTATQMYASVKYDEYDIVNRWENTHFFYASYSDRRFYLEGSGFSMSEDDLELRYAMIKNTRTLFDPEDEERADLARELGIDYVFVTTKLHPVEGLESDDYTEVFSNKDVTIYQVKREDQ